MRLQAGLTAMNSLMNIFLFFDIDSEKDPDMDSAAFSSTEFPNTISKPGHCFYSRF